MGPGCSEGPIGPEAEIGELLATVESEFEAGSTESLPALISAGYSDARGNDRKSVISMLEHYARRGQGFDLNVELEALEIYGDDAANVALDVRFGRGPIAGLRLDGGHYRVTLDMERSKNAGWTVVSSRWARAGEALR